MLCAPTRDPWHQTIMLDAELFREPMPKLRPEIRIERPTASFRALGAVQQRAGSGI